MRLWSLHPQYLDPQGLVALWREGLLAQKVLAGNTRGYKFHPQLERFKQRSGALGRIKFYLHIICDDAERRGYNFDRSKLGKRPLTIAKLVVNSQQMEFEWNHLLKKQKLRSKKDYLRNKSIKKVRPHPCFKAQKGPIAEWERP